MKNRIILVKQRVDLQFIYMNRLLGQGLWENEKNIGAGWFTSKNNLDHLSKITIYLFF